MSQANRGASPSPELAEWMESLRDDHERGWRGAFTRTVVHCVDPDSVELDPLTVL